jgi:protein phosphatase
MAEECLLLPTSVSLNLRLPAPGAFHRMARAEAPRPYRSAEVESASGTAIERERTGSTMPSILEAHVSARTDVGKVRKNNEDRLLVFDLKKQRELSAVETEVVLLRPRGVLLVVADGMGGMASGETASQMSVENFLMAFIERMEPMPRQGLVTPSFENPRDSLTEAVRETNARVFARASAERGLKGMGTTMTAAFLEGESLFVAQVGDSRAYLLRGAEMKQLTRDQTLLASLAEKGGAPPPGNVPWKNMLLQAVGSQADIQVAMTELPVGAGDRILLCSDGLHGPVSDTRIGEVLSGCSSPEEIARLLTDEANQNGGPDNISVIACVIRESTGT